jgi:hypothetical protein
MSGERLDVMEARMERLTAVHSAIADNIAAISEEMKSLKQKVRIMLEGVSEARLRAEQQSEDITRLENIVKELLQR